MKNKNKIRIFAILLAVVMVTTACSLTNIARNIIPEIQESIPELLSPEVTPEISVPSEIPVAPSDTIPIPDYADLEGTLEALYEAVSPGVVSLQFTTVDGGGQGTGFVIDKEGHIVTNYHVAGEAQTMEVHFPSGLKVYGTLVGSDLDSDLAVIKVDVPTDELVPLSFGESDMVKVGQTVVAIGNPYGLSGTMTVGVVSARGRVLDSMRQAASGNYFSSGDLIQTDALINPGNSGGPLLNLNGEVIGINRAIQTSGISVSGDAINTGIGFAISSNIARKVVPSLIETGTYAYPYLGLSSLESLSLQTQELLELPQSTGAYVTEVIPGGPAAQAGVQGGSVPTLAQGLLAGGDLIVAVDGNPIKDFSELMSYMVINKNPGEVIIFTVLRGDQQLDLPVTLGARE